MKANSPAPVQALPTSVTNPLGLSQLIREPSKRIDWLPFADLALIVMLVLFFSDRFLFLPGIPLELPTAVEQTTTATPDAVATVHQGLIVTTAGIFPLEKAQSAFETLRPQGAEEAILLLLLDRSTPVDTLTLVTREARAAGFDRIHLGTRQNTVITP